VSDSIICPQCDSAADRAATVCATCGTSLSSPTGADVTRLSDDEEGMTRLTGEEATVAPGARDRRLRFSGTPAPSSSSAGWLSSSGAIDHGRFEPGTILGGRYRIVGRLGRGGMGEVFRADDLKLGQPVALKFLPPEVDRDPARLTQLHTEVRMARQVSHPNVCRVYDIDEVEGHTFLSMEYVDGEDLATLLKRIGRFSEERGLEIARQMCAGLAAAHERGVVHRDFKPANVMLDGAGKVRITDFGLAGASGEAIRAGTPAYMAPEQIAGGEVTARSDIYALGLVLYELFTGQRALEGRNLAELIHKREQSGIVAPTEIVRTLDSKIEAAIMRCLKPEAHERTPSALAVAAALPGGDPLAAALAAGETPSPDMVAAAGTSEALHPAIGLAMVVVVVAGLLTYAGISDRVLLYSRVPMQRSLDSLEDRAREILSTLGLSNGHSARGLAVNFDVIRHVRDSSQAPDRWNALDNRHAPVMLFWYRSSPQPLAPQSAWRPTWNNPPNMTSGMARLSLDDTGRLIELEAVPPRSDEEAEPRPAPWPALFAAAGLDMSAFQQVTPVLLPQAYASERAAWEGPLPGVDGAKLHVEAAAHRGLPVGFRVTGPWEPVVPRTTAPLAQASVWRKVANVFGTVIALGVVLLARSNLRAGRGDRRGAGRLFAVGLAAMFVSWLLGAPHYSSVEIERERLFEFVGDMLILNGIVWLLYIGLEPYVRRFSPKILISWTRVLNGQVVDPRVGRDVLIGVVVGVGVALIGLGYFFVPTLMAQPPSTPRTTNLNMLLGPAATLSALLRMIPNNLQNGLLVAVAFGVGRAVTRRVWGGAVLASVMFGIFVLGEVGGDGLLLSLVFVSAFVLPLVAVLIFGGILPVVIAFLVNQTMSNSPMTLDPSKPYADAAFWGMAVVLGLTLFGYYASRGGQPLFGRLLQTD
jgi:serine/threonine-protein kinase